MKKILSVLICTLLILGSTPVRADDGQNYDPNQTRQEWKDFINGIESGTNGDASVVSSDGNMINPDQQPENKYNIKTLAGSLGVGYNDGTVDVAKLGAIADMVVDKNGNVFFLDSSKNTLRKYDPSANSVTTVLTANDKNLSVKYVVNKKVKTYMGSTFVMSKLAYDISDDSVYVGGSYNCGNMDNMNEIFKISPKIEIASYMKHDGYDMKAVNPRIRWEDFLKVDGSNIYFSDRFGMYGSPSNIIQATKYKAATTIGTNAWTGNNSATGPDLRGKTDAIITNDSIYIYNIGTKTLSKISKFPRSYEVVAELDETYDSVTTYDNNFYLSKGSNIYKLDINGSVTNFINSDELTYDSQDNITQISNMCFDSAGNLILYDIKSHLDVHGNTITDNATIRKITLK